RKFTVEDTAAIPSAEPALPASVRQAISSIASHQQPQGYWLTSFTKRPSYRNPRREMNIFLNAMMIDTLAPMAQETQLTENLRRVRRYLTAQIEEGGLVRYHGRPDPAIDGILGCEITPDADDTSLVWRVASATDRVRLGRALATMRKFRTAEGLYRTWLAPRERYQCIDPGRDPNPADIGIQMHVFMLLARQDPPAARELCSALLLHLAKDDLWVYYQDAPIVPFLRQTDLQSLGCAIELPPSCLARALDGQQEWVSVARFLRQFATVGGTPPRHAEVRGLLETIARDDFALLRRSPPLLYHNDLTASVSRFYWSEDMGYALWLRLNYENERRHVGEVNP
ncbi:MAG TPA: hypothetical protein VMJ34_15745, partial [Bryobacteraceae bacterium]|nr:hypothetical protein [Bryobacteraceae bacterium]